MGPVEAADGRLVGEGKVVHRPGALRGFLEQVERGSPVAIETVGNWYWVVEEVEDAGCVPRQRGPALRAGMGRWCPVLCALLATACAVGSGGHLAPRWAVVRDATGLAVTDGRHRFRLPDEPGFLPRERWRLVSTPDTDGDGRREAVVEGFTGGAHCCFVYLVFESRTGGIRRLDGFDLGNGRLLRAEDLDRDGRAELVGLDDRLAYFDDLPYALSPALPLVLCRGGGDRFEDCTGRFPGLLSSELSRATRSLADKARRLRTQQADREFTELEARSEALTVFVLAVRLGRPQDGRARVRRLCRACLQWLDRHSDELFEALRSPRPLPWAGE